MALYRQHWRQFFRSSAPPTKVAVARLMALCAGLTDDPDRIADMIKASQVLDKRSRKMHNRGSRVNAQTKP